VIERSNSWMERCKSLVKNFERTLEHSTTKIHLCFLRLLLRQLAVSGSSRFCVISLTYIGSIDLCALCVSVVPSTPSPAILYLKIHFTHQT
jgi:hypothetical protein